MKTLAQMLFATLILSLTLAVFAAERSSTSASKLRHVVAFKYKPTATSEQIKQVEDAFRDLKKQIKEIQGYEWGTNVSKENHNKGCTHGFILTFKSESDRDTYIDHPAHKDFGKLVGPVLDDVFVIDFWAKD
jgi:heme-degrading monooxygenase HmoA